MSSDLEREARHDAGADGPQFGRYRLLKQLGEGGMGTVWLALDTELQREVALKVPHFPPGTDPSVLQRFKREAQVAARIDHPNFCPVLDIGYDQGRPFYVMPVLKGRPLADYIGQDQPWPVTDAARLVTALASALAALHGHGIVHRDLKPANVLLAADGTPKITDFGLAKRIGDASGQTQSGSILGTPSSMAPEQAGGRSRDIGPAADVYALGAILYELLVGRPPFKAATPLDTVLQLLSDEPVPPRLLHPGTPRDLEAICLKCLAKDPNRRYADAAGLATDLGCYLGGEPVAAQQSGLLDRLTGALDRVQFKDEFAAYGTLLLRLAPLMLLPELWITTVVANDWPSALLGLGQFGRAIGFVLLVGQHRGWRWWPRGAAERQLWGVWGGYLLACFVVGLSGRLAFGFRDTALELRFYQGWAALTALAFFSLAGNFWGYCAVIGVGFLGLAFVMAADLRWAPLEFGLLWSAVLILLGLRLRRLGAAVPSDANK